MTNETISLIASAAIAVISIIANIVALAKKKTERKKIAELEASNELLNADCSHYKSDNEFLEILNKIPEYVTQAEQIFTQSGSGVAKLTFVLNQIKMDCIEANTIYDENFVKEKIEEVLEAPTKNKTKTKVEEKTAISYTNSIAQE